MTNARELTILQALKGEQPDRISQGSPKKSVTDSSSGKGSSNKSPKKQVRTKDGRKFSGDELDNEEENKPPKGARNMLTDKSEERYQAESEHSESKDATW